MALTGQLHRVVPGSCKETLAKTPNRTLGCVTEAALKSAFFLFFLDTQLDPFPAPGACGALPGGAAAPPPPPGGPHVLFLSWLAAAEAKMVGPQKGPHTCRPLESVHVTLLGKRTFVNAIKLGISRREPPGLRRWVLNPMAVLL